MVSNKTALLIFNVYNEVYNIKKRLLLCFNYIPTVYLNLLAKQLILGFMFLTLVINVLCLHNLQFIYYVTVYSQLFKI